ncbi:MAG: RHS repeat-associated core domain-containing protein [Armatimonadetes bacterium]|nr:RHS repeat-associated core domain-containing protein [Armatimonadota bacterium]
MKTACHGGLKSFDTQTNSAQAVVGQRLTDAFGNQISSSGVWKGRFAYGGPYGYQEDPDTGLRLLGHRYYDSSTGRFLTRDPIKDGRNWYVYCDSNPVTFADSAGLSSAALVGGGMISAAVIMKGLGLLGLATLGAVVGVVVVGVLIYLAIQHYSTTITAPSGAGAGAHPSGLQQADSGNSGVGATTSTGTGTGAQSTPWRGGPPPPGLIPVWRVGGSKGRWWAFEDPRFNPNFYYDYGMYTDGNAGNQVSGGYVRGEDFGTRWRVWPSKDYDGTPLNNGRFELEIVDTSGRGSRGTVYLPWTVSVDPNIFRQRWLKDQ